MSLQGIHVAFSCTFRYGCGENRPLNLRARTMVKKPAALREWLGAAALSLALHLTAMTVPVPVQPHVPPDSLPEGPSPAGQGAAGRVRPLGHETWEGAAVPAGAGRAAVPYRPHDRQGRTDSEATRNMPLFMPPGLPKAGNSDFHSLVRATATAKLLPPAFGTDTIPPKPEKDMLQLMGENADEYLLGDVFRDAVPADPPAADDLALREAAFRAGLRRDIEDGRLDMPFSSFIIAAEYYQLGRALLEQGLQPAFSLDEAMARYEERRTRVAAGLPAEIDGFAAVMILQRYGENKFYPGNGSGMLLDSLFHNLNDCEAGTKEVLAYLDDIYPHLVLGSNRGLLRTTGGEFIGHMQVYLGPDAAARRIVDSERGVVIETTRVGRDSILPYLAGEVFPLEDFVARYYPELVAGTPLADLLAGPPGATPGETRRIVGTSDHPLKMSYGGSGALLTAQYYDLANIRTRRIENEFLRSSIPGCDPRIDPTRIDRTNLFSNFVAIDPKLRKNLIDHYLADLEYWDNQVMPQWRQPAILATYGDLAGSLLEEGGSGNREGFFWVDGENTVGVESLASHRRFLQAMRERSSPDPRLGTGRRDCRDRTLLDERLLEYLFAAPTGPGLFFLPELPADLSWMQVLADAADDCLAIPAHGPARSRLAALEEAAMAAGTSLRRELHRRAIARGLETAPQVDPLAKNLAAVAAILTGSEAGRDPAASLAGRHSAGSSADEPSVRETAEEFGRTGIHGGLLWDLLDFLGAEETRGLLLAYARRADLRLSLRRAGAFVDTVSEILLDHGGSAAKEFLADLGREAADPRLALAARLARARLAGEPPAAVSAIAMDFLRGLRSYRAEDLLDLLRYGLRRDDAAAFLRARLEAALATLPTWASRGGGEGAEPKAFLELVELARTVDALTDLAARRLMAEGLTKSLLADFRRPPAPSGADFGVLFSKLSVLALLRETCGGMELRAGEDQLLGQAVRFAAGQPPGKLMVGLLDRVFTPERYGEALSGLIGEQFAELARLRQTTAAGRGREEVRERIKVLLGDANVLVRLVLQADDPTQAKAAGLMPELSGDRAGSVAARYLERLHRGIAVLVTEKPGGDGYDGGLYLDDRVREAMALLAFVQRDKQHDDRVKFRKIKDIRDIKDPSAIRVIEAERKITRQDMSLLTLALNEVNSPREIRRAWEDTIAVTDGHLALARRDEALAAYLFAPHFPYLRDNDLGFFFSPETVEDLHNADQWGGRNDILLSSYLHFKNLPERLPGWLLRAALARSEFERRIIDKFERESFLPMILECAADHETLPEGLFRAQWTIRRPFGEDIFPGTLLLLRMGYLAITPEGRLVFTSKYTG